MSASRQRVALQMHTIVDQPLTNVSMGRISCKAMGIEPFQFVWYGPDGRDVQTDITGEHAYGVLPGRYRIVATDAQGQHADVTLDVEAMFPSALVVTEYRVTGASTSTSEMARWRQSGRGWKTVGGFCGPMDTKRIHPCSAMFRVDRTPQCLYRKRERFRHSSINALPQESWHLLQR